MDMQKVGPIRPINFFKLLAEGGYEPVMAYDGSPMRCIALYIKINGNDLASSVESTKHYFFVKAETETKISLIAIDADGEVAVFVKRKNKKSN